MNKEQVILDDPLWEYVLVSKLQAYLPCIRKWWENYSEQRILSTGVQHLTIEGVPDEELPPGLMVRMTNTPVRSPIKNVQVFPFLPTAYLQISGVSGGVNKMIERVCSRDGGFVLEEFTLIEKHNLPSTYHKGQFIAFIPTEVLKGARELGKYVYFTVQELCALGEGVVLDSVKHKVLQYNKN